MNTQFNLCLSFLLLQGNTSSDSGGQVNINWFNMLGQFFFLVLLFAFVLFGAYYVTKCIGKIHYQSFQSKNIKVLESISIAPQKTLKLVKVGNTIYLLGITKENIVFLSEIDENHIISSDHFIKEKSDFKFDLILKDFINKFKNPSQEKGSSFDGEVQNEKKQK